MEGVGNRREQRRVVHADAEPSLELAGPHDVARLVPPACDEELAYRVLLLVHRFRALKPRHLAKGLEHRSDSQRWRRHQRPDTGADLDREGAEVADLLVLLVDRRLGLPARVGQHVFERCLAEAELKAFVRRGELVRCQADGRDEVLGASGEDGPEGVDQHRRLLLPLRRVGYDLKRLAEEPKGGRRPGLPCHVAVQGERLVLLRRSEGRGPDPVLGRFYARGAARRRTDGGLKRLHGTANRLRHTGAPSGGRTARLEDLLFPWRVLLVRQRVLSLIFSATFLALKPSACLPRRNVAFRAKFGRQFDSIVLNRICFMPFLVWDRFSIGCTFCSARNGTGSTYILGCVPIHTQVRTVFKIF
mmetsp:Transcript_28857/g.68949  ORF Transcript_28857/g.68949 Transcript_28857/m.68949 type:complete len:360 (-) Transcript_28857:418-1497(-)